MPALSGELVNAKAKSPSLFQATNLWQFGDWQTLSNCGEITAQKTTKNGKLALLAASAKMNLGKLDQARELIAQARKAGCSKVEVAKILAAGVHLNLGTASYLIGRKKDRASAHFHAAAETFFGPLTAQASAKLIEAQQLAKVGASSIWCDPNARNYMPEASNKSLPAFAPTTGIGKSEGHQQEYVPRIQKRVRDLKNLSPSRASNLLAAISDDGFDGLNVRVMLSESMGSGSEFEKSIIEYDPTAGSVLQDFKHEKFVKEGYGRGVLNAHRVVRSLSEKKLFFEKVYDPFSLEVMKLRYFNLRKEVACRAWPGGINFPEKILDTKRLVFAYFPYVAGEPKPEPEMRQLLKRFLRAQASQRVPATSIPSYLKLLSDSIYLTVEKALDRAESPLAAICRSRIESTRELVWSHGSYEAGNVLGKDCLIDLDNSGFYPIGWDIAFFLSKSRPLDGLDQLNKVLDEISMGVKESAVRQEVLNNVPVFLAALALRVPARAEGFEWLMKSLVSASHTNESLS